MATLRTLIALLLVAVFSFQPAIAKQQPQQSSQNEQLIEQGEYTNSDGKRVHKPAHTKSGNAPEGATAKCRDDTYSFSAHRRGTCSHHGGVAKWLD